MKEGSEQTITLPLLKGMLNFIWNHGWYHTSEGYDTDFECSFTVSDAYGNELFASDELEDGIFMTYDNNCDFAPLACYPVENVDGMYLWNSNEEYGAFLAWDAPTVTTYLDHFNVYRVEAINKNEEPIAEILYDGTTHYEFFENLVDNQGGGYLYWITSIYIKGDEKCESTEEVVSIIVTDIEENAAENISVYPNPTNGQLNVNGNGMMHITMSNLLGQSMLETTANGSTTLDLSRYESGMYLIRIETESGITVQKINLRK